jgi:hypothetical protein
MAQKNKYIIINMECMEIVEEIFDDFDMMNSFVNSTFIDDCGGNAEEFREYYKVFKIIELPVELIPPSAKVSI